MIDNTAGVLVQDNLLRNFPVFVNALKAIPGGLPNLHIAVITSDLGAGDGSIASCDATGGDAGRFQYSARGTCFATGLAAGATYISNVGGVPNYTGTSRTCSPASPTSANRGAASSSRSPPSSAPSAPTASPRPGEPGVPAAERRTSCRPLDRRGRLLAPGRERAVQHDATRHWPRRSVPSRASGATSSGTCATASRRRGVRPTGA